jgi:hypothetical protein
MVQHFFFLRGSLLLKPSEKKNLAMIPSFPPWMTLPKLTAFVDPLSLCMSTSTSTATSSTTTTQKDNKSVTKARWSSAAECPGVYTPVITGTFVEALGPTQITVSKSCWTRNTDSERNVTTLAGSFQAVCSASSQFEVVSEKKFLISVPCDAPVSENSVITGFANNFFGRAMVPIIVQENGRLVLIADVAVGQLETLAKPKKPASRPAPSFDPALTNTVVLTFQVMVQYNSV